MKDVLPANSDDARLAANGSTMYTDWDDADGGTYRLLEFVEAVLDAVPRLVEQLLHH